MVDPNEISAFVSACTNANWLHALANHCRNRLLELGEPVPPPHKIRPDAHDGQKANPTPPAPRPPARNLPPPILKPEKPAIPDPPVFEPLNPPPAGPGAETAPTAVEPEKT